MISLGVDLDKHGTACAWGWRYPDGGEHWYDAADPSVGVRHRTGAPAMITEGAAQWYQHGRLHRLDGPAVEYANGDCEWWVNDCPHRVDGPAVVSKSRQEWWVDGERHRVDGPAVVTNHRTEYWIQGVPLGKTTASEVASGERVVMSQAEIEARLGVKLVITDLTGVSK